MERTILLEKIKDTKNFRKYREVFEGQPMLMKGEIYVDLLTGNQLGEKVEVTFKKV